MIGGPTHTLSHMQTGRPQTNLMLAEEVKRAKDLEAKKHRKAERKAKRAGSATPGMSTQAEHREVNTHSNVAATPVAFVFPGQGSQAVGMLQVAFTLPHIPFPTSTARLYVDCVASDASCFDCASSIWLAFRCKGAWPPVCSSSMLTTGCHKGFAVQFVCVASATVKVVTWSLPSVDVSNL